ncbi:MAG: cytochrome C oxidase subunit I, partial [Saprospiraceae bacterium]|nr:cytochrome C oxidase subunit I [Saprospiraceae bacterium]
FTGLVNASYSLNNVVHNTAWIPGHFHMTIAGPVFLGILGMTLYMLEKVTGKDIAYKRIATIVPYLWTVGMLTFSLGLSVSGLLGAPRRTNMGLSYLNPDSPLFRPDWVLWETLGVVGGCMMFAAAALLFLVLIKMVFTKKTKESVMEFPEYEVLHDEPRVGILDSFRPWLVIMGLLIILAYVPALRDVLNFTGPGAEPYAPDNPAPLELYEPPAPPTEE